MTTYDQGRLAAYDDATPIQADGDGDYIDGVIDGLQERFAALAAERERASVRDA